MARVKKDKINVLRVIAYYFALPKAVYASSISWFSATFEVQIILALALKKVIYFFETMLKFINLRKKFNIMLPIIYLNCQEIGLKTDSFSDYSFEHTHFLYRKLIHVPIGGTCEMEKHLRSTQ